ncbi:hypothetical protein Bca4012_026332 [Brassica carinata]|uniref:Uncharacterized protein n=1 Tax=Brassica carinata TaxID=52824 RepID=A0A8X8AUI3_BRACI|nr:hypothetical protein Bca52824_023400 [Brassica carinata]
MATLDPKNNGYVAPLNRDDDYEVGEVVEVHDNKSVVSISQETNEKGGWTNAIILLGNQGLATLAFFGVGGANNVSKWTGTVYISLVGAFFSDSYWRRYLTCTIFQIIFVLGVGLLSFTSWFFLTKPRGCGDGNFTCTPPSSLGVAFGYRGHQPTLATSVQISLVIMVIGVTRLSDYRIGGFSWPDLTLSLCQAMLEPVTTRAPGVRGYCSEVEC